MPIQRELCTLKTTYAELLIDMFAIFADEQRHQKLQEARKGSVEKVMIITTTYYYILHFFQRIQSTGHYCYYSAIRKSSNHVYSTWYFTARPIRPFRDTVHHQRLILLV